MNLHEPTKTLKDAALKDVAVEENRKKLTAASDLKKSVEVIMNAISIIPLADWSAMICDVDGVSRITKLQKAKDDARMWFKNAANQMSEGITLQSKQMDMIIKILDLSKKVDRDIAAFEKSQALKQTNELVVQAEKLERLYKDGVIGAILRGVVKKDDV